MEAPAAVLARLDRVRLDPNGLGNHRDVRR